MDIRNTNKEKNNLFLRVGIIGTALFLLLCLLFFIWGYSNLKEDIFNPGSSSELGCKWDYETSLGRSGRISLPTRFKLEKGEEIVFTSILPQAGIDNDTYLCILAGRDYSVYIDGLLRYEHDHIKEGLPSRSVKSYYALIKLRTRDRSKEIRIEKREDKVNNGYFNEIRIGNLAAIKNDLVMDNGFKFYAALLLFVLALVLFVSTVVINRIYGIKTFEFSMLSLSMLCVAAWIITDSYMFQVFFGFTYVDGIISYILMDLLPIPFLLYINEIQEHRFQKIYSCFMAGLILEEIIVTILNFTDIYYYEDTLMINTACIVIVAVGLLSCIFKDIFIDRHREYITVAVGIAALTFCTMMEIIFINRGVIHYAGAWMVIGIYIILATALIDSVRRAIAYERNRREAIEANIVKSNFLANMSHEIRTPINTIMGMNEMIIRESRDENITEYADYINRSGNLLLTIIGDVLDFSKIESGKLNPVLDKYETAMMLKDISDFMNERTSSKGLEAKFDIDEKLPSVLYGDVNRIKQILINLITNAVKYTKEGSVTFRAYREESDEEDMINVNFEVIDTGMGIKEEDIGKLFDSFTRMDENKNRNIQGTGLGLAIVKSLTQIMKGSIDVRSKYGEGSVFHVSLPQKVTDPSPIGNILEKKVKKASEKKGYKASFTAPEARILAVDDTSSNLMIIKYLLKETKIVIDTADGGEKAISDAMENKYDIILLDHMMPEPDGIEVLKRIKGQKDGPNIDTPVIVLTANATSESRQQYLACGFDDYITKPVNGKELEKALMGFLPDDKVKPANDQAG